MGPGKTSGRLEALPGNRQGGRDGLEAVQVPAGIALAKPLEADQFALLPTRGTILAEYQGKRGLVGRAARLQIPLTALDPAQGTGVSTVISLSHPK